MILMFDVGNTELKMAIAKNDEIIKKYRFRTNPDISDDEMYLSYYNIIKDYAFSYIIIASVVPSITFKLKNIAKKYFFIDPLVIEQGTKTGLKIIADNPGEVGADLVACSVRASNLYKRSLVIDLGTAIKYLYVENKTLNGVIISPGIETSLNALTQNTALLPNIELKTPDKVLGYNTVNCMQSGIIYGTAAQIDGLIKRIEEEVKEDFQVILTGGLAEFLWPVLKTEVDHQPYLIFEGLLEILNKNK